VLEASKRTGVSPMEIAREAEILARAVLRSGEGT